MIMSWTLVIKLKLACNPFPDAKFDDRHKRLTIYKSNAEEVFKSNAEETLRFLNLSLDSSLLTDI